MEIEKSKDNPIAKYLAWFAATGFVFFQLFLQMASTMMNEHWAKDFNLNEIELGHLSSIFFYSYIGLQIPAGILYDKYSTKMILFVSAMGLAISSIMFAYVQSYQYAMIARFLMGLGAGSGFVGLLKIIQDNFSKNKFAFMFGLAEAVGMIGIGVGLVALTEFYKVYSWRESMYLFGGVSAIFGIGIYLFVHDKKKREKLPPFVFKRVLSQVAEIVTNKQVIVCTAYAFFIVSFLNCFTSLWGEPFLRNTYDLDPRTISLLLSMVFVGLAIGSPLNGWVVKEYGRHKEILLWEAGLSTIVTIVIINVLNVPVSILYILFFLIGFLCSGYGICYALVNEAVPSEMQATAVATANMIIVSSAPALQVFVGAILNTNSFGMATDSSLNFRIALTVLPISYFLSFLFGMFIRPTEEIEGQMEILTVV